jgi:hypothetical protein
VSRRRSDSINRRKRRIRKELEGGEDINDGAKEKRRNWGKK